MNIFNISHHCTCANHLLLNPGSHCETCMGIVPEQQDSKVEDSVYDAAYFDALEMAVQQTDLAA